MIQGFCRQHNHTYSYGTNLPRIDARGKGAGYGSIVHNGIYKKDMANGAHKTIVRLVGDIPLRPQLYIIPHGTHILEAPSASISDTTHHLGSATICSLRVIVPSRNSAKNCHALIDRSSPVPGETQKTGWILKVGS